MTPPSKSSGLVVRVPRLGSSWHPGKGLVSANLPTLVVLKVWVRLEKCQIKETYHDVQSGTDIPQDQSISLSTSIGCHPPFTVFSAAAAAAHWSFCMVPSSCVQSFLLPIVPSAEDAPVSLTLLEPSGASSKWHLFQKVLLDPPARSTHYLFSMLFQTI